MLCLVQPVWQTRIGQGGLGSTNVADGEMKEVIYMLSLSSFVSKCFEIPE